MREVVDADEPDARECEGSLAMCSAFSVKGKASSPCDFSPLAMVNSDTEDLRPGVYVIRIRTNGYTMRL